MKTSPHSPDLSLLNRMSDFLSLNLLNTRSVLGGRAFSVTGIKFWYAVVASVRSAGSHVPFRSQLRITFSFGLSTKRDPSVSED